MIKIFRLLIVFFALSQANCQNHGKLQILANMPSSLKENSGLVSFDDKHVWTIEDNGNKDDIYQLDLRGNITIVLDVKGVENDDWEDLARDQKGHLYIGDFGNNNNERKKFIVYKTRNPSNIEGEQIEAEVLEFSYPEQEKYPPEKENRYFDTEAFFHWNDHLYFITKNRTRPYDGKAFVYKIPDSPGSYEATLITDFFICDDSDTCSITSADISPDGNTIALLTYGYLILITDFTFDDFTKGTIRKIDLGIRSQLEAVCFKNDSILYFSDERSHSRGGNLYSLNIDSL